MRIITSSFGLLLISTAIFAGCVGAEADGASDPEGAETNSDAVTTCSVAKDGRTNLQFVNNCSKTVVFEGSSIASGTIGSKSSVCRNIGASTASLPSLRYWGYYQGQNPGNGRYTLAEFTLNTSFQSLDWYDISHVDADNIPMRITPVGGSGCRTLTCTKNALTSCPASGQWKSGAAVISCVNPNRDDPNNSVSKFFEAECADAYSWSGDDAGSMAACNTEDYQITFCP